MAIGTEKSKRIARVAALTAVPAIFFTSGFGAWSASHRYGTTVAPSPSSYPQSEPSAGFRSQYVEVNGFRMHYVRGGKGSPVVLIHGFPQTWAEWRQQMGPLSKSHTVIAVDLRGTGDSQVTESGYQTAQLADDVHQLLLQLGLNEGVQVVGHDVGVWVTYAYAAQWPSEVRSVAVMEAPIADDSYFTHPALNADPKKPAPWHWGMFQLPAAEKLIADHERDLVHALITEYRAEDNKSAFTSSDYDYYAHFLKEPGRTKAWMSIYRQIRANVQQDKEFRAQGRLKMPVLAIGGEHSYGGAIADQARDYAVSVDGRVLKNSGHFVTEENPQELTAMLQSFLQE